MSFSPQQMQEAASKYNLGSLKATASSGGSTGGGPSVNPFASTLQPSASQGGQSQAPTQDKGSFFGDVGQAISKAGSGIKQAFQTDTTSGSWLDSLKHTAEAGLQAAGSVAGGINDIAGSAFNRAGGQALLKQAPAHLLGPVSGIWNLMGEENRAAVKEGLGHIEQGSADKYNAWAAQHPEAAKNIENVSKIAQAVPMVEGGGMLARAAPELLTETLPSALEKTAAAGKSLVEAGGNVVKGAAEKVGNVGEAIAPTMKPEIEAMGTKLGIDTKDKAFQDALESSKTTYTPKAKEEMMQHGNVKEVGLLKTPEVLPTEADIRGAHAVKDLINPKMSPVKQVNAINKEIGKVSTEEIRPTLEANNAIYNRAQAEKALMDRVKNAPGYNEDPMVKNAYDRAVREMLIKADEQPGHTLGFHDARIGFDKSQSTIFPKTGDVFRDTLGKTAHRDVRNAANEFIESKITNPEARAAFKEARLRQSNMFHARDNIAASGSKGIGKNAIQRTLKAHPWLKTVAKLGGVYEGYHLFHELL